MENNAATCQWGCQCVDGENFSVTFRQILTVEQVIVLMYTIIYIVVFPKNKDVQEKNVNYLVKIPLFVPQRATVGEVFITNSLQVELPMLIRLLLA